MKKLLLFTFIVFTSWFQSNAQYCASVADSTQFIDITKVHFYSPISTLNNSSTLNSLIGSQGTGAGQAGRYANYTISNVPIP